METRMELVFCLEYKLSPIDMRTAYYLTHVLKFCSRNVNFSIRRKKGYTGTIDILVKLKIENVLFYWDENSRYKQIRVCCLMGEIRCELRWNLNRFAFRIFNFAYWNIAFPNINANYRFRINAKKLRSLRRNVQDNSARKVP